MPSGKPQGLAQTFGTKAVPPIAAINFRNSLRLSFTSSPCTIQNYVPKPRAIVHKSNDLVARPEIFILPARYLQDQGSRRSNAATQSKIYAIQGERLK